MKKKTYKIIICISLIVMLFTNFTSVFGATNPSYTPATQVSENALDSKIKSNILLDTLAGMINALASLAEYLIGAVFKALTGDNIFPWADRIIFNGIGFLDVNFLNPASNSLFVSNGSTSILGKVVYSVYSTIFSLAVLFLGVAVGIMAIRLALSSIAAEKAKYKQAIVNWATCIVMLFLMHYILAFVFWINEQLVEVASGILIKTIDDTVTSIDFTEALNSVIDSDERVNNFCKAVTDKISDRDDIKTWAQSTLDSESHKNAVNTLLLNDNYVDQRVVYVVDKQTDTDNATNATLAANIGIPRLKQDEYDVVSIQNTLTSKKDDELKTIKRQGYYEAISGNIYFSKEVYLSSNDFKNDVAMYAYVQSIKSEAKKLTDFYSAYPEYKINTGDNPNSFQYFWNTSWNFWSSLFNSDDTTAQEAIDQIKSSNDFNTIINDTTLCDSIAQKRLEIDGYIINAAQGVKTNTTDIIANLGKFFKESAYTYTTEGTDSSDSSDSSSKKETIVGWRATKVSVTGALLYAIFIFQSCMYLIMYVKRLFYVMMLSMFGPIVVIYDFFMKSAG